MVKLTFIWTDNGDSLDTKVEVDNGSHATSLERVLLGKVKKLVKDFIIDLIPNVEQVVTEDSDGDNVQPTEAT